jgi:hypothetical protein
VANELVGINSARTLTADQFAGLSDVSPELEWLINITNEKTGRAHKVDVVEFIAFTNLKDHSALRTVARSLACCQSLLEDELPCLMNIAIGIQDYRSGIRRRIKPILNILPQSKPGLVEQQLGLRFPIELIGVKVA